MNIMIKKEGMINMDRISEFYKVSYDQFKKDWLNTFSEPGDEKLREEQYIMDTYDSLEKPVRATAGSAGYDFYSPLDFVLEPGEEILFPTGMKAKMGEEWVLLIFPRSSLGFKYFTMLNNTVGVVDATYYNNVDNEGHMFVKLHNCGNKPLVVNKGDRVCQGIFMRYGITVDDNVTTERSGGFGSTGR